MFRSTKTLNTQERFMQTIIKTLTGVLVLSVALVLMSCSSSPSAEDLKALDNLKAEVTSMEKSVADKQKELAGLERQLAEQNGKLQQCQADQDAVKKALGAQ
jgi:septal ring factor EnvC (AmiA/AmiB activator)